MYDWYHKHRTTEISERERETERERSMGPVLREKQRVVQWISIIFR